MNRIDGSHKGFVIKLDLNDFLAELIPLKADRISTSKTTSVNLKSLSTGEIVFLKQSYDFQKIWNENNLEHSLARLRPFWTLMSELCSI